MRRYEILWYTKDGGTESAFYEAQTQEQAFSDWVNDHKHFLEIGSIQIPFFLEEVINHPFMKQHIDISMIDNTQWSVPLYFIVRSHAKAHKSKFDNEMGRSILEGTIPYFERNPQHITNWIKTGMGYDQLLSDAVNITPRFDNEHLVKSVKLIQTPYMKEWSTEK